MKKSMLLVPALVLSLMLTACGNGTTDSGNSGANSGNSGSSTETKADNTGSNSGSSAKALSVNIWDNNQLAGLQKIADEWTAESGIPVNINVVEWDSYWTLLEAGASGGEIPDVFWMHSNTAQMYMENEILLDLDDYIAADDSINLDDYYPGITELYSSGGKQYALPKDHDTIALLYNQEIFDRYNVEALRTTGAGTMSTKLPLRSPRRARLTASTVTRPTPATTRISGTILSMATADSSSTPITRL
jgi:multiple sugar transport system substrate-binding protein